MYPRREPNVRTPIEHDPGRILHARAGSVAPTENQRSDNVAIDRPSSTTPANALLVPSPTGDAG
jgi:hypothetical protein